MRLEIIMKKFLILAILSVFALLLNVNVKAEDNTDEIYKESNWELTRTTMEVTEDGIVFNQTEMGIPDNHAIAIYKVPYTDVNSFEVTFSVVMDEFVASGRSANDVWAGVGIMGLPVFINWRNSVSHGLAKDSPGLFTRFFNLSGDLRYESSVYQEDYHTTGRDDPSSEVFDTWQLFSGNGSCSASSDITFKMAYDGESKGKGYYNCYLNGQSVTPLGQASFIDQDIIFKNNEIYLLIVMNTQEDDFNSLSKFTLKSVNGVSLGKKKEGGNTGGNTTTVPGGNENKPTNVGPNPQKSGCKSSLTTIIAPLFVIPVIGAIYKKRKNEENI